MDTTFKPMLCPCCWIAASADALLWPGDRLKIRIDFDCGHSIIDDLDPVLYAGWSAEQIVRSVNTAALKWRGVITWG